MRFLSLNLTQVSGVWNKRVRILRGIDNSNGYRSWSLKKIEETYCKKRYQRLLSLIRRLQVIVKIECYRTRDGPEGGVVEAAEVIPRQIAKTNEERSRTMGVK